VNWSLALFELVLQILGPTSIGNVMLSCNLPNEVKSTFIALLRLRKVVSGKLNTRKEKFSTILSIPRELT